MKNPLLTLKEHTSKYLNSLLVLGMDMLIAIVASLIALLLVRLWVRPAYITTEFASFWMALSFVASFICFYFGRTYRIVIRHSSLLDLRKFVASVVMRLCVMELVVIPVFHNDNITYSKLAIIGIIDTLLLFCLLIVVRVVMVNVYDYMKRNVKTRQKVMKVFVYGTGDKSVSMITRLQESPHYEIVGFITYGDGSSKYSLAEKPILNFADEKQIAALSQQYEADAVLFATESDARDEQERLVHYASTCGLKLLVAPSVDEIVDGQISKASIREVKIEDLLGRAEIKISMDEIISNFKNKTIMVTGAAGSIGSELCRQLATFGIKKLVLFDNAETPMHNLRLEFDEKFPDVDYVPVIGDVRQKARLDFAFRKFHPQVVFHAAAYKHVPLMEENPCEAVLVNVAGSHYVANKCIEYDVEKMIMISTDKAVNPTNIMGCTKRLAEIYVQSLGLAIEQGRHEGRTKFITTRFGNVLGSNGSVIPRFRQQIENGGPVTVTHPDIIRFFMTIPEACRLVMEAATLSTGNQIFVFDMGQPVKIDHLARRMIELSGLVPDKDIKVEYTGLRPGEKLYEEVLANAENTIPTDHDRIKIARVREYDYYEVHQQINKLTELSAKVLIPEMVHMMKEMVPEFHTTNPDYVNV